MSELFITQVATDEPTVLLIGEGSLVDVVSDVTAAMGLQVVVVPPASDAVQAAFHQTSEWYKIFLIQDTTTLQPIDDTILAELWSRQTQVTVILGQLTPISSTPNQWASWQAISSRALQTLAAVEAKLPKAKIVVVRDWIDLSGWHDVLVSWGEATANFAFIDPQIDIFPLQTEYLSEALSENIFRPTSPAKMLIQGHALSSHQLLHQCQTAYHRLHGMTPSIQARPVVGLEPSEAYLQLSAKKLLDLNPTIQKVSRRWPSPSQLKAARTAPATLVPPTLPPKLNRATDTLVVTSPAPSVTPTAPTESVAPTITRESAQVTMPRPVPTSKSDANRASSRLRPNLRTVPPRKSESLVTQPEAELEQAVVSLFSTYRTDHKRSQTEKMVKETRNITTRSKRRKKVFFLGLAGFGSLILVTGMAVSFVFGGWLLKHNLQHILDTSSASQAWVPLATWLQWENQLISAITPPGFGVQARVFSEVVFRSLKLRPQLMIWQQQQLKLVSTLLGAPALTNNAPTVSTENLYQELSQLQAALKEVPLESLTASNQAAASEFQAWLEAERQAMAAYQQLQPWWPTFFGQNQRRVYAIVVQNEQELRPTGGFIQALALLTVDKGTIVNVQVFSSYELDSKQTGEVKPPADLQAQLGENRWFLRDANWNPDFPATAAQISWFVEHSGGQKPDGVIGLTIEGWQQLIKATGPVELTQFNETITDRNLNERLEFHSEIQFANASDKPDYTSTLLKTFLGQLGSLSAEKQGALVSALVTGLKQQNVLFSMVDPVENQPLAALGWDGALLSPDCPTRLADKECLVDSIAQVETNVGINKANYYLDRRVTHEVTIEADSVRHQRTLVLKNTAQTNAWPKGAYKTYLRWYVPADAQLDGVTINGTPLSPAHIGLQQQSGKTVWSIVSEVPILSESTIVVQYHRPLPHSRAFAYAFFDQKQPGTQESAQIQIKYPKELVPQLVAPQATLSPSAITFTEPSLTHQVVGVSFK